VLAELVQDRKPGAVVAAEPVEQQEAGAAACADVGHLVAVYPSRPDRECVVRHATTA
jgi:hypothetical protein